MYTIGCMVVEGDSSKMGRTSIAVSLSGSTGLTYLLVVLVAGVSAGCLVGGLALGHWLHVILCWV